MAASKVSSAAFFTFFFAFFVVIGLFVLAIALSGMAQEGDAMSWPSTTGTVMGSYVSESYESSGGKHPTYSWHYYPHVTYSYAVGSSQYQGSNIWLYAEGSTDRAWAYNTLNYYPSGSAVQVYYNPSNPSQALLDRSNLSTFQPVPLLMAAAFICIGVAGIVFTRRKAKRTAAAEMAAQSAAQSQGYQVYDVHSVETWLPKLESEDVPEGEPLLWEGRPEKTPFLVIFPEQTILAGIFFVAFSCAFLAAGLVLGVFPLMAIALAFLAIAIFSLGSRIRSSAKRYHGLRYRLTSKHLSIEGGQWWFAYLQGEYGRNGFRNVLLALNAVNESKADPKVRNIELLRLVNPEVRTTLGQRLFKVGSIYAMNEKLPLIECIREPDKVLKMIQDAAWKARREAPPTAPGYVR